MSRCAACDNELPPEALACPTCGALLHKDALKGLYAESRRAEAGGDLETALRLLRQCQALLPIATAQYQALSRDVQRVSCLFNARPPAIEPKSLESAEACGASREDLTFYRDRARRAFAHLGPLGDGLAEMVFLGMALIVAARSLAHGLFKPKTLVSLIVWIAALALLMGWKEAALFGMMIYLHEMGHVLALQYLGLRFSWPFFVPFLGAFVLIGKIPDSPRQNAAIALSGPIFGILASGAVFAANSVWPLPEFCEKVAYVNLLINYLNLLPFWILDGARVTSIYNRKYLGVFSAALLAAVVTQFNAYAFFMLACFLGRFFFFKWQLDGRKAPAPTAPTENLWGVAVIHLALLTIPAVILTCLKPS